jgi:prepilin-type N-terminal cleavage/methylation domain-containing protein
MPEKMLRTIKQKAFTLIELLVVVAIISLLSSVVIASLQGSREKAAITKLKEQVRQIQTALELYRSDNGRYPASYISDIPNLMDGLDNYIENTTLDTNQIRSFTVDDIGYINIENDSQFEEMSCEGFETTPYAIYIYGSGTSIDDHFLKLTLSGNDFPDYYCLSTPI